MAREMYPNTKIMTVIEIYKLSQSWAHFLWRQVYLARLAVPSVEQWQTTRFRTINKTYTQLHTLYDPK